MAGGCNVHRRLIVQVPAVAPVPFGTVNPQTGTWEYKNKALGAGVEIGPNGASLITAQVRFWQSEDPRPAPHTWEDITLDAASKHAPASGQILSMTNSLEKSVFEGLHILCRAQQPI